MKRFILSVVVLLLVGVQSMGLCAGTFVETASLDKTSGRFTVTLACTGDSSNGSLAVTALSSDTIAALTDKYFLYSVCAYPTSGGTAPSATTITVTNAQGRDVLGGTGSGSNTLVPETLEKCTAPYNTTTELYEPYPVDGTLSVTGGTGTASQQYTLKLTFMK